jgi:hypothetical protein
MERKVHIGNKWWKIMTIYSKEMKTTRRRVEDAMKENREDRTYTLGSVPIPSWAWVRYLSAAVRKICG